MLNDTALPPGGGDTTPKPGPVCDGIQIQYEIAPAVICALCFIFGILYCFFGYRFFKATMFMTGFIFGAVVTYLICLEENLLPLEGKIGVAVTAGVLCGLVTMLVQYVGLFMTGFDLGLLLAVAGLIVMEQFYHPSTKWITIGILFGSGLLCALLILYFQKSFTMLGTSIFGAGLLFVALDYYIEMFMMVNYVWERIKADVSEPVCWFSWCILGLWPAAFLVGAILQWRVTGKGFDHNEVVHNRRHRTVNLQRMRTERRSEAQHSRYRHLYQVRRGNGDVVSQSYVRCIQSKLSPSLRALANLPLDDEDSVRTSNQTVMTQVPS